MSADERLADPASPTSASDDVSPETPGEPPRGRSWSLGSEWHRHPTTINAALVVTFALLGLIAALLYNSFTPHLYASTSVVRVYNPYRLSGSQFGQVDPETVTTLELRYAESKSLERAVDRILKEKGVSYDSFGWTAQTTAATVTVRCLSKTAVDSRNCAAAFASEYTERRADSAARPLESQVSKINAQLTSLSDRVDRLQTAIDDNPGAEGRSTDANRGRLAQQQSLLSQISQLTISKQATSSQAETVAQNYQIVSQATVPDSLAYPVSTRNLVLGLVVGVLVGLGLAVLATRRRLAVPRTDGP